MTLHTLNHFPPPQRMPLLIPLSIAAAIGGLAAVEASFARVNFPVSLREGQLAFDGELIKGYYATLMAQGTFDDYVITQVIDFGWIIGLGLMVFVLHTALGRRYPLGSTMQRFHFWAALLSLAPSVLDALENITSFFMLANPTGFPNGLALVYSSFAQLKWWLAPVVMTVLLGSIVVWLLVLARRRIGQRQ